MKSYEKPTVIRPEELSEGIYLDSGDNAGTAQCESRHMNGVYHRPKDWYQDADTMLDRGCEGCPAGYSYTECRREEDNFGDPLMPKWELLGYSPESNYKY